jgi:acyl dehydratase
MSTPETPAGAPPPPDDVITFSKTVGESDVYLFAGITGDLAPVHVDQEFMKANSPFGERIAHGVLVLGFTSTASTMLAARLLATFGWRSMVSLGYDGIRFIAPVRSSIAARRAITLSGPKGTGSNELCGRRTSPESAGS